MKPRASDAAAQGSGGLIEVAALAARLEAEAEDRCGGVGSVSGATHRWRGLHAFRMVHEALAEDAQRQLSASAWDAFDSVTRQPARDLADLARKLAVLHIAWRADPAESDPCSAELALLGAILADAVALAAEGRA